MHDFIGCSNFYNCHNIQDSNYITNSEDIDFSSFVHNSSLVSHSSNICYAEDITNSNQIFRSSFIYNSEKVFLSNNINSSTNIISSEGVYNSTNIYNCNNIIDCSELRHCNKMAKSLFCAESKNLKNCMFCVDLRDKEFYIFNQPIDEDIFEYIFQHYQHLMNNIKLDYTREPWPEAILISEDPNLWNYHNKHYLQLADRFWRWIRTIPNFDLDIVYRITLNFDLS